MQDALEFIGWLNAIMWGPWTLYLLLSAGILFTVWTKFSQFRVLGHGVAVTRGQFDAADDPGAINHFQALSAALSATIGLGNIGGVAIAIAVGGPGALFWMWVVGFLGMALKTVEITLAMMYRNTDDPDDPHGGAMWVIDKTLGQRGAGARVGAKIIGGTFSITAIIFCLTGGNMFQSWNVADLTLTNFGAPKLATGIVLAVLVGLVIVGGIKRIGNVAGRLVPVMCILYLVAALAVVFVNISELPAMLLLIVHSAFSPTEASGAFLGASTGVAFAWGLKRALFSNEAGLGSAPMAHAAAKTNEPAREGIVGGLGPFIDTICICTLTALVILSTGTWNRAAEGPLRGGAQLVQKGESTALEVSNQVVDLPALPAGESWGVGSRFFLLVEAPDPTNPTVYSAQRVYGQVEPDELGNPSSIAWDEPPAKARWTRDENNRPVTGVFRDFVGATLTSAAFDRAFPGLGKWLVTLASWLFALSTMISWSYYGEQSTIYLAGKRAVLPYKLVYLVLIVIGSIFVETTKELDDLSTFGAGLMLWANMVIVLWMGPRAVRAIADYLRRLAAGEFHPHAYPSITDVVEGKDVED